MIWWDAHDGGVADLCRTVHAARLPARLHATTADDPKVRGVVNPSVFEDVGAEARPDTLRSVSLRD